MTNADTREIETGLADVGVGTLIYVLQKAGLSHCYLSSGCITPGTPRLVGRARTLRCEPMREDVRDEQRGADPMKNVHRVTFDSIREGEVLVVGARGSDQAAIMGDVLAARLLSNGCAGVVTDGMIRDVAAVRSLGLPVFAHGVHSATFGTTHVAIDADVPVGCAGVLVCPGDYLVGDDEGVAVIPASMVEIILASARQQELSDVAALNHISSGGRLVEALAAKEPPRKPR